MKTISRILIILAAAALVGGIIFALVGNNTSDTRSGFDRHGDAEFRPGDNDGNFAPRHERDREGFGGGLFLPGGVIKGLLIISVVMIVWLNTGKLLGRRKAIQVK